MLFKRYNTPFKRAISCFDFYSYFLVLISCQINMGKEISLPGFRKKRLQCIDKSTDAKTQTAAKLNFEFTSSDN